MGTMEDMEDTDVLIAGAGPAGSSAALALSEKGMGVIMLESKMEIGSPVICADSVNLSFDELSDIKNDPRIFIRDLAQLRVFGPSRRNSFTLGASFSENDAFNSIVERDRLDKEIASRALIGGSRLRIRSELTGVEEVDDGVVATYRSGGKYRKVRARILVIATGNLSMPSLLPDTGKVDRYNFSYNRIISEEAQNSELHIESRGNMGYNISRFHNEQNSIMAWPEELGWKRFLNDNDGSMKGRTVISGSASAGFLYEPDLGNRRVLHVGSRAGLYDPFLLTGFREAFLSGRMAAQAVIESGSKLDSAIDPYSKNVARELIPGMKTGSRFRVLLMHTSRENIDNFVDYLSGFEFREISASEILRETGLKDSELESMLPVVY